VKLIHVLNHFLPSQIAGTEVYVWALCKHLSTLGYQSKVIIPNYENSDNETYVYDGLTVLKYAEPTVQDRALIMGRRLPEGLDAFKQVLVTEKPDIIHFHEFSTGNGIVQKHIEVAKQTGAKVLMTFHLAGYSCRTGTLMYKSQNLCDGIINVQKCSACYLHDRGYAKLSPILLSLSAAAAFLKMDTASWDNRIGTALATTTLLSNFQADFRRLTDQLDALVTLTHWYKDVLLRNGVPATKITHIPQGLPMSSKPKSPAFQTNPVSNIRLVFIGRISAFKGLHLLIDALLELQRDVISLDIYGQQAQTDYEQMLRQKTSTLPNVSWKGRLAQEDVVTVLSQYDLLCLCSTFSEMSPLVIQEAFAAGIPVLASNVYGNAEQVQHKHNGLLFTFNRVDSLKEQLSACISHPGLLTELKNNIKVSRSFREVAADHHTLYQSLLQ
jgi:glycosyltransferase involved in cell wall biosynthesis